ncbi:MAG TPA: hypothetical protein VFZ48_03805 [Candidatus Saccharimonadales bacterium]
MRHTHLFRNWPTKRFTPHRKSKVSILYVLTLLGFLFAQPGQVFAHQSPTGCNSNRFNISIVKDKTEVKQGDTLTYTVTASNVNSGANLTCDITAASILVQLPATDGSPTGTVVTLTPSQDFPAGSSLAIIGTAQYVVNVSPGVEDIVAEARAEGVLHDAPVEHSAIIIKTLGTAVIWPTPNEPQQPTPNSPANNTPRLPNTGSL